MREGIVHPKAHVLSYRSVRVQVEALSRLVCSGCRRRITQRFDKRSQYGIRGGRLMDGLKDDPASGSGAAPSPSTMRGWNSGVEG